MQQASLGKLDAPTRVKLRSTQILTSFPQIVSELVQNSLDAGASAVDIGIDCEEWICWVKDNGCGISKDNLSVLGQCSEEGRYGTSKPYAPGGLNSLTTFGFRGEALASAAELGCLEISSRTGKSRETWSIIMKGGSCLYSGPAVRWRRESSGTAVCVRDAFYNLPVRRLSHPSTARTLELIRQDVETLALIFTNVTFTVEDINKERQAGPSKGRELRISKTSSSLAAFRNIYGRALTEHVEEIDLSSGQLKLEGFISLNGAHSRFLDCAFFCLYSCLDLNHHPVALSDLHHIINSAFASSTFGKNALDEAGELSLPRSNIRRSPRKVEKKPVYVLNLTVPPSEIDNSLEPAKTNIHFQDRKMIATFLSSSIQDFLTRHGFLSPANEQCHENIDSPSPRKRRKSNFEGDSGYGEEIEISQLETRALSVPAELPTGLCLSETIDENQEEINWTDPHTGEAFVIDTRTGNSRLAQQAYILGECETDMGSNFSRRRRTIPYHNIPHENVNTSEVLVPEWLRKALKANNAFEMTDSPIPELKLCSTFEPDTPNPNAIRPHWHDCNVPHKTSGYGSAASLSHCFRKSDLRRAQIISQVDRKFIACLFEDQSDRDNEGCCPGGSDNDGHALVLIDQHAADERVRVECFLKELCLGFLHNQEKAEDSTDGVRVRELSPPFPVLLTLHEVQKLKGSPRNQAIFRHWGFHFADLANVRCCDSEADSQINDDSNPIYAQVLVQRIPEVVGDKLQLGEELQDLVKGFLGELEMEDSIPMSTNADEAHEGEFDWLKALRWCPRELLDLINSKACRGAIMFNDALSISQCESLVQRLSETAFPFQCAHGRYGRQQVS
ncbi:hypothetical protein L208DRAFT_1239561 [Tricholoma matsutake]|nr:hypothetical protein L208DRAFT_1239561 [Tricholoma matsutake 945]